MADDHEEEVGYRKPPKSTRFKKGQSGNPRGRPKGSGKTDIPYDGVLGQKVIINDAGTAREVTAAEAFVAKLAQQALEGDSGACKLLLNLMEDVDARWHIDDQLKPKPASSLEAMYSINKALEPLRMGRVLDKHRDTARAVLEPWIVEAALERLGDRRLSQEQQREVFRVTRTPKRVNWPEWWTELPG